MKALAEITVRRWFPAGSQLTEPRKESVEDMVESTTVEGFAIGANALMGYDLYESSLEECKVKTLLVAGSLDGGGNVSKGLQALRDGWSDKGGHVSFEEIENAGHLPMVDATGRFWEVLETFLRGV